MRYDNNYYCNNYNIVMTTVGSVVATGFVTESSAARCFIRRACARARAATAGGTRDE